MSVDAKSYYEINPILQRANDAAFNMARECVRQIKETGQERAATMRVGNRFVMFAGATQKGGAWWIPVAVDDVAGRAEIIAAFPELREFTE